MRPLLALLLTALLALAAEAQGPKPGTVNFRGKNYEAAALPAEAGGAAKSAVLFWAPWAKSKGYRLDLDPSRRVLLLTARANVDAPLGLVLRTEALFDGLFPAPVLAAGPETGSGGAPVAAGKPAGAGGNSGAGRGGDPEDPEVIPEDPEAPPPLAPKTAPPGRDDAALEAASRRVESVFRADSETAALLIAKNTEDYASALAHLAAAHPYLAEWKAKAVGQIGFALGTPLCGAYNENSPGQEEWSPDNELVHRTMALLVLRRFSSQPYWLQTALAWHAEMAIQKSIYCMPYRDGFVGIGEHGGWIQELSSLYGKREKEPLRLEEFLMKRGVWNDKASKTALGMVDYMARTNSRALAAMMEELRRFAEQDNRVTNADGTWMRNPEYEVPPAQQQALLERYFGERLLRTVIAHWAGAAPPK
ncbi:MAG: hypothetical protein IPK67_07580 [Planctomycetes bacterium]|nr:hypothetical protein [Planctomycetota bacterium]